MTLLDQAEIAARLPTVPSWTLNAGGWAIATEIRVADFVTALALVNQIGAAAEARNHHPDIDIRWNIVRLALSTHSAGGLTAQDFDLAAEIDQLAAKLATS